MEAHPACWRQRLGFPNQLKVRWAKINGFAAAKVRTTNRKKRDQLREAMRSQANAG